ncbi:regulator of volume decrease after cellular swelling-domain-containing protein [Pavlovales sp. CCMP2436]|nr:regulator of volume decrease after cellular swelling-domain-containing protein [Pavlovales sp. CCMP2436]
MADTSSPPFALLPNEEVRHSQAATSLHVPGESLSQRGTLFVTTQCARRACARAWALAAPALTSSPPSLSHRAARHPRRVAWLRDGAGTPPSDAELVCFPYPSIGLHAVCTDLTDFVAPCLYLQVEKDAGAERAQGERESGLAPWLNGPQLHDGAAGGGVNGPDAADAGEGDDEAEAEAGDDDEGASAQAEVRFVPEDAGALEAIFRAMSECAALHPCDDEDDEDGEGDDGEGYDGGMGGGMYASLAAGEMPAGFITADTVLNASQQAMLDHFNSVLHVDDKDLANDADPAAGDLGRFDDAEAAAEGAPAAGQMED